MKKLLFGAYSLDLGGIEKALVILVNKLQEKGYDITLVLEKKQGIVLNEINPQIKSIRRLFAFSLRMLFYILLLLSFYHTNDK